MSSGDGFGRPPRRPPGGGSYRPDTPRPRGRLRKADGEGLEEAVGSTSRPPHAYHPPPRGEGAEPLHPRAARPHHGRARGTTGDVISAESTRPGAAATWRDTADRLATRRRRSFQSGRTLSDAPSASTRLSQAWGRALPRGGRVREGGDRPGERKRSPPSRGARMSRAQPQVRDTRLLRFCPIMDQRETMGAIIRVGLNLIPSCGGAIASAWSEWESSRRFRRVEDAVEQLRLELESKTPVDHSRLGEAEMQLLEEAFNRVSYEHRQDRRRLFVRILVSGWRNIDRSFEERRMFCQALDALMDVDLQILSFLRRREEALSGPFFLKDLKAALFRDEPESFTKEQIVPAVTRLAATFGFIRRDVAASAAASIMTNINPDGLALHADAQLTDLGERFLRSLDGL